MSNPTRQQLDELDALLQRMLSLPVNQPGDPSSTHPAPEARPMMPPPGPAYAVPPSMPRLPMAPTPPPAPRRRAEPPRGDNAWQIPLPPNAGGASIGVWPMGVESLTSSATSSVAPAPTALPPYGRLNVATVPSPDEMNRSREVPPAMPRGHFEPPAILAQPMAQPVMPQSLVPAEAPLPFYLWPMGAVDRSMGAAFAAFGPLGRWLGQGGGKILVGWVGMLMLIGAATWGVMDYMGWSW